MSDTAAFIIRPTKKLHRLLLNRARSLGTSLNKLSIALLMQGIAEPQIPQTLLIDNSGEDWGDLVKLINKIYPDQIIGIILFGSIARGKPSTSSDIDLLIAFKNERQIDRDIYKPLNSIKFAGREVSPICVHLPDNFEKAGGIWFEVAIDGIVLSDQQLKLSQFLGNLRELIVQGKIVRKTTYGQPYWIDLRSEGSVEL